MGESLGKDATDDLKYYCASAHSYLLENFSKNVDKGTWSKSSESSLVHYILPVVQVSFHKEYELQKYLA